MGDRNSFLLYINQRKHINLLSREQRGDLLSAIFTYAAEEELPEMDGMTQMAFSFISDQMDRDSQKYQDTVKKRSEAGKLGGRPKANDSNEKQEEAKKANGFFEKQTEAKKPDNDTVTVTNAVTDIKKKDTNVSKEKPKRFFPPSLVEVQTYCKERNNNIDAEQFIDFYAGKGWMVGKNGMKDWKACIRTWEKREKTEKPIAVKKNAFHNFEQRDTNYDELVQANVADWLKGGS